MKNIILIIRIAIFFLSFNASAQDKIKSHIKETVIATGTVTDEYGLPLPGAVIRIAGTNVFVQTDFDGRFLISTNEGQKMEISYLGFRTQTYTVNKSADHKIILEEEFQDTGLVVYAKYSGRLRGVAAYYMFGY